MIRAGIDDMERAATRLLSINPDCRVFCLNGPLGAGKTTLVNAFCKALEVTDTVQSPTFPIVHEYQRANGQPVYHFDLYRISSGSELSDLGFEDYIDSGYFCFIEWPDIALDVLSGNFVSITLSVAGEGRHITMENHERIK